MDTGRRRQVLPLVLSWMETAASPGVPNEAPVGGTPKDSLTLSPDSARLSSTAETSKDLEVSPASKVTLGGTPE